MAELVQAMAQLADAIGGEKRERLAEVGAQIGLDEAALLPLQEPA